MKCLSLLAILSWSLFVRNNSVAQEQLQQPEEEAEEQHYVKIAGYLPDYRIEGVDLTAASQHLDDVYLFSLSPQSQLGVNMFKLCCLSEQHFAATRSLPVNRWVTVGGGGRSHKFFRDPTSMMTALKDLTKKHNLYGVDFDCEDFRTHEDFEDYHKLLAFAAETLHQQNVQVSVALHIGQTLPTELYQIIDRVNLMTYDMPGTTYHADYTKAQEAVRKLVDSGCPPSKVFLGIPAYGRHKRQPSETKTYSELVDNDSRSLEQLRAVFAVNDFTFDSPAAVAAKTQYAQRQGLGGVFVWELGQDRYDDRAPDGILLRAAGRQRGPKRARTEPQPTSGMEDGKDEL